MAIERKPIPRSSQTSFSETEWVSEAPKRSGYPKFEMFSEPDWKQIRVGYIDPDRGYIKNADLCQANAHAKLNPGAQFIIQNRKSVRYMNINEVNSLTNSTYSSNLGSGEPCSIDWAKDDPNPLVYFAGGGGVGAAANPVFGKDSKSVIALHLAEGGFGYKYPPKVIVKSKTGVGGGVVAESFLGQVHTGTEVYGEQSDIENYYPSDNQVNPVTGEKFPHNLSQECSGTLNNVGFGSVWDSKGNPVGEWKPSFYNEVFEDPFKREILDYQEYLRTALKPWFASKRLHLRLNRVIGREKQLEGEFIPDKVSCSGIDKNDDYYYSKIKKFSGTSTKVYDVVANKWGKYEKGDLTAEGKYDSSSTNAGVREVEFKVFVHVATAGLHKEIKGGLRFEFREVKDSNLLANPVQVGDMGSQSYGPHRFSISVDDIKEDSINGGMVVTKDAKTVFRKVKPGTLYHVISRGEWKGKKTEQGLSKKLGLKSDERQLKSNDPLSDQSKVGKTIFADLLASANDDDDLQVEAEIGQFTQVRKRFTEDGIKFKQPKSELKLKTYTDPHKSNYGEATGEWEEVWNRPKGHSTYDLFYKVSNKDIDDFNSTNDKSSSKNKGKEPDDSSFMNKYAISPVPTSDDKGSDFANQMFSIEWDEPFTISGNYTFRAQADGECYFYMDGVPIDIHPNRSSPNRINSYTKAPSKWKEFVSVPNDDKGRPDPLIKRIRCDITNSPRLEDVVIQEDTSGDEYIPDAGSQFQDIDFDVFSHVTTKWSGWDKIDAKTSNKVTFRSVDSASYTNKFHLVELLGNASDPIEWVNLHPKNNPIRVWPPGLNNQIFLEDHHGDDANGTVTIMTSGGQVVAKFSDDGRSIYRVGNSNDPVTIKYSWRDNARNHADGFKINGVFWNNKAPGYSDTGSMEKTIDIKGRGGNSFKEIMVLTRTESKTAELKSGVDYGCFFTSSGNQGNVTAHIGMNSVDDSIKTSSTGKTIGMNDQGFSTGGRHSPRNMVVECSKGRIRSADGTDDTGDFGHLAQPSNFKQILWSMPKQAPSKPIDGTNGLKFTFNAVDGSHSFEIKSKDIHPAISYQKATLKKMTKKVRVNTKYIVQATQLGKRGNIEQGLITQMGRKPKEVSYNAKLLPSTRGQFIFADVIGSGNDNDDIQVGTSKGYFTASNKRALLKGQSGKGGPGGTNYDLEFYYKVKTKSNEVIPSGDITFKTEKIFNTVADIKNANRDLYRINSYGGGGFLNESGVCPFPVIEDLQNSTVNDNPYAGEHKIVWNNIKFPVDADYNIKVAVDDAAVLKLEGPNGVTTINKSGFAWGKSTGSTIFRQYLKKGSYKLTVTLIQKEGGRFGFKALTQAERQQRKKNIFDSIKPAPLPPPKKTSMVTFTTTSAAGFTNSCTIAGIVKLTRNAKSTHEVEVGKEYNVSFASSGYGGSNSKIRLKMADGGKKIKMEDHTDADFNDLVLTINGGRFTDIRDNRFVTYVGGLTDGDASLAPPPATGPQSADDIELKGINPMAVAIDIKVKYGTGKKVKSQSWNENPFGVALSIEAPIKAPPQDEKPLAEGRCPRNPFWTTRFPIDKQTATETWFPVYLPPGKDGDRWHEFMNQYAMSPIPPMDDKGTDFGGRWYTQTWKENIDSPGWYTFKAMADDNIRFFIDNPIFGGNEEITFFKKDKNNAPWGSLQEPLQKSVELYAGMTTFEVWVKNISTTKYDTIKKKVFSARDWVGKGLNEDDFDGGKYDKHKLRNITFDVFSHVAKSASFYGKEPQRKTTDVTFTCTHGADYHNKFYVVELLDNETTDQIEWVNLHPNNNPINVRSNGTHICLVDDDGRDCNGNVYIQSNNAKFSADGRSIYRTGTGLVKIYYQWKDHGRNHADGFKINGVFFNNKAAGFSGSRGNMTKEIEVKGTGGNPIKEVLALTGAGPKVGAETKTVELKTGVNYGVYFTSSGNRSNVTAEMTNNGETIGIDDLGRGGSKARTNMVVTCSHGKFRSRDGTDDTGVFGHTPLSSNFRQVLWQVPKSETGLGVAFDRPEDELQFTFVEKGGKHKFTISGNELKNTTKDKSLFLSNTNSSLKKKIKMNTKYKVTGSFKKKSELVEQGLIKKMGRKPEEKDYNANLLPSIRGSYIFADVATTADENDDLQIGCTEGYFTASNKRKHTRKGRGDTYDLEYFVEWTPPAVTLNEYVTSGTTKNGVTYEGPYLFKYNDNGWSSYMNKFAVSPLDDPKQSLNSPDDRILGTKTLTWKNVDFKLDGRYNYKFIGDDKAKLYVGGKYIKETSNTFKSKNPAEKTFNIPKAGRYDITVELTNTGTNGLWFDNPSGMVLEITTDVQKVRYDADGVVDSKSWAENPVGVAMECIPPPCAKERNGEGVVDDLLIIDPGPGELVPPEEPGTPKYPVTPKITTFIIDKPGINYNPNEKLRIGIGSNPPIWRDIKLGNFGEIEGIVPPGDPVVPPGSSTENIPTEDWPDLRIEVPPPPGVTPPPPGLPPGDPGDPPPSVTPPAKPTGVGAVIIPKITVEPLLPPNIDPRTGLVVPEDQIIQVTDLVGLKQTGWYDGRAYYGAVFYKNGVKYAGYYETAGTLIQVYDSKQESIDAEVTTPPSAILRQGTDVTAADPRLNIPGTPQ